MFSIWLLLAAASDLADHLDLKTLRRPAAAR
jgi:hypothetical protein